MKVNVSGEKVLHKIYEGQPALKRGRLEFFILEILYGSNLFSWFNVISDFWNNKNSG